MFKVNNEDNWTTPPEQVNAYWAYTRSQFKKKSFICSDVELKTGSELNLQIILTIFKYFWF